MKSVAGSVRSKSMRSRGSHYSNRRRHHMYSKKKAGRFNEELPPGNQSQKSRGVPRSRASQGSVSQHSKRPRPQQLQQAPEAQNGKAPHKSNISEKGLDKLKSNYDESEKVSQHFAEQEEQKEFQADQQAPPDEDNGEPKNEDDNEELDDEIDSLYYGDGYSEYDSRISRRTGQTSATYISKLEKELQDERVAREKLEKELEEIKRISSEISSHLGLQAKKQEE